MKTPDAPAPEPEDQDLDPLRAAVDADPLMARAALAHMQRLLDPQAVPATDWTGKTLGRYHVEERIGGGGMGIVYRARQEQPFERVVALKLLRPELITPTHVTRFQIEQQSLARMDHPGIAKVYDADVTEDGRLYFAMELIDGLPLTEFCDARRLGVAARLGLMTQLCDAVQHAHQRGVLHRDLKPSNVLAFETSDERHVGQVKVIDFGLAREVTRPSFDDAPTVIGTPLGTLGYMSPEQAGLGDVSVDTRTDVYSLGVILYRLLTGSLPFSERSLSKVPLDEALRVIREDSPTRPSAQRPPPSWPIAKNELRGELDWITLKALEKDPDRRYASAAELANDIARFLDEQPVLAGPPSVSYRLSKLLRRRRKTAIAVALTSIALLIGGATILRLRWRSEVERLARVEAGRSAAQLQEFLISLMSSSLRRGEDADRTTVLDLVRAEEGQLTAFFGDQPYSEALMREIFGRLLHEADHLALATDHYEAALALYDQAARDGLPEWVDPADAERRRAQLRSSLARAYEAGGRTEESIVAAAAVVRESEGESVDTRDRALSAWASILSAAGRGQEAVEPLRQFLAEVEPAPAPNASIALAELLADQGAIDDAVPIFRRALRSPAILDSQRRLGLYHRAFGEALMGAERYDEAETELLTAHRILRDALGATHRRARDAAASLIDLYRRRNGPGDADRVRTMMASREP